MLALLFGAVSLLYATVGQAGGTAFLAVMAFSSFAVDEMRPTALLLNIVASTYSSWLFNRGKLVDWAKLRPLLLASLPTALLWQRYKAYRGISDDQEPLVLQPYYEDASGKESRYYQ